jgi:hypothetical protein
LPPSDRLANNRRRVEPDKTCSPVEQYGPGASSFGWSAGFVARDWVRFTRNLPSPVADRAYETARFLAAADRRVFCRGPTSLYERRVGA